MSEAEEVRPSPTSLQANPLAPPARRVAEWVAARILDRIARGELVPGERLPGERQLAEQLNVSRVSVRAALQTLKTQGFLMAVQGGGTRVVSSAGAMDGALTEMVRVKRDNLCDLVEIRMALESWAARRAAERATPEQVETIRGSLAAMATPAHEGHAPTQEADFHMAVAQAAGSPVYLHLMATIRDILGHMLEAQHTEPFAEESESLFVDHHQAIFDAIARHDPDGAAAAVTAHLGWVLDHYQRMRLPEDRSDAPQPRT